MAAPTLAGTTPLSEQQQVLFPHFGSMSYFALDKHPTCHNNTRCCFFQIKGLRFSAVLARGVGWWTGRSESFCKGEAMSKTVVDLASGSTICFRKNPRCVLSQSPRSVPFQSLALGHLVWG